MAGTSTDTAVAPAPTKIQTGENGLTVRVSKTGGGSRRFGGSSGGGGAIGWMREFELRADHTFQMNAYPSLTERGTWRRVGTQGARAELVYDENSRLADGSPIITPVTGLAEAGQPLRVLDIGGQRYPRVQPPPSETSNDPTQPSRAP